MIPMQLDRCGAALQRQQQKDAVSRSCCADADLIQTDLRQLRARLRKLNGEYVSVSTFSFILVHILYAFVKICFYFDAFSFDRCRNVMKLVCFCWFMVSASTWLWRTLWKRKILLCEKYTNIVECEQWTPTRVHLVPSPVCDIHGQNIEV